MTLNDFYGDSYDEGKIKERYLKLNDKLKGVCGNADKFFSSPGRAEIVGNHTDHNLGKVIVSAITCDVACAVKKRDDDLIEIYSDGFSPIRFNADSLYPREEERGRSVALARGVAAAIVKRGYKIGGFSACTNSTVFRGAGVSSSAAFEVLVAEIINNLYLGGILSPQDKAEISKYAENEYFYKPCGLLDQTGIALGGLNKVDFKTPTSPVYEKLSPPEGYAIVIVNAGGNHSSLTEHYAAIKEEMRKVARAMNKTYLREVSYDDFISSLPMIRKTCSERAILRAMHFFDENERVDKAAAALKERDNSTFLYCIQKSGESSLNYLQNVFVPGSEVQPIALALALSSRIIKDGACKLHGGGFAGTMLAYVSNEELPSYLKKMAEVFGENNVFHTETRNIGTSEISL